MAIARAYGDARRACRQDGTSGYLSRRAMGAHGAAQCGQAHTTTLCDDLGRYSSTVRHVRFCPFCGGPWGYAPYAEKVRKVRIPAPGPADSPRNHRAGDSYARACARARAEKLFRLRQARPSRGSCVSGLGELGRGGPDCRPEANPSTARPPDTAPRQPDDQVFPGGSEHPASVLCRQWTWAEVVIPGCWPLVPSSAITTVHRPARVHDVTVGRIAPGGDLRVP